MKKQANQLSIYCHASNAKNIKWRIFSNKSNISKRLDIFLYSYYTRREWKLPTTSKDAPYIVETRRLSTLICYTEFYFLVYKYIVYFVIVFHILFYVKYAFV